MTTCIEWAARLQLRLVARVVRPLWKLDIYQFVVELIEPHIATWLGRDSQDGGMKEEIQWNVL